ncbi:Glycosyltransferase involved in cell wall bisynthesis [Halorubrum aquaticum]|uniref:Glycosyltransferase involved in cell wall bisynthesis n=1 Tax=Halorubrum aquaticum TaxID=387340 RepID=A0A1I3CXH5_9EURY|nr:glycosyltransferase family 4 protein [Halorubrum aquaticum]SFH79143.1 Glycosyltransferase involved in cell wall bisynthesis [Halorubrum aquaticum]
MATAEGIYGSDSWRNESGPRRGSEASTTEEESVERVLFVYGPTNTEKITRHVKPLADAVDSTTLVCTDTDPEVDGFRQVAPPSTGYRLLDLFLMSVLTAVESVNGEYDAVVTISLFPHGCLGLLAARYNGIPAHLGIIGCDIDVHARAWYGRPVRWLMRRFDVVTVPGPTHRRRLHRSVGVPWHRTAILANPVDVDRFTDVKPNRDRRYDLLWVGRMTAEKRPLLFVDVVAAVAEEVPSLRAVMLGDGALSPAVQERIAEHGLEGTLETPGWTEDPIPWYADASVFVLTSERDALPLTLIEAMASGTVPVTPAVGNVGDLLVDGWNGRVDDPLTVDGVATAVENLLADPDRRARIGTNARGVRDRFSYDAATEDWRHVTRVLARYTRR